MFLSIDIGGSFIKYAYLNEQLAITSKWKKPTRFFSEAQDFYDELCKGIDTEKVHCIGVSAPGVITADTTVASKAAKTVAVMYQTNIRQEIEVRLKKPAYAINDARAAGLCEVSLGNGQAAATSVYWLIGTGIGGAIFHGQELVTGADNLAGEFSHLPIAIENGRLKGISSVTSMTALRELYQLKASEHQLLTGEEITQRYLAGEAVALQVMEEWCLNIVQALYVVTMFYNPEVICIGGGISEEQWFIEKIQKLYSNEVQHVFSELVTTRIEACHYNNDANLLGAILHAKQQWLKE
ncbi:ROK family protein [Enterococcus sp. UD-01]|jgi:predicted NBD/HSP70 family sugar kinase|uniref:ROK family protein n=1 Tax=Enterococcus sp. UD-01 TaxID=3373911 RepID=UPI003834B971